MYGRGNNISTSVTCPPLGPEVALWELGRDWGVWWWCRGSLVPVLDFRVPDLDFRKHRRAMTGVAEPRGIQCGTCLEPQ